jgi:hypothetical protein
MAQLERALDLFRGEQLLLLRSEELSENPDEVVHPRVPVPRRGAARPSA